MQLLTFGSLLALAAADLALTSQFEPITALVNQTKTLKVIFLDFDKTLVVGGFGFHFLELCGGNCTTYTPTGDCPCNATEDAFADFWSASYAASALEDHPGAYGFNGTVRRDRIKQTLQTLAGLNVTIRVLSTSWYSISAAGWANFLNRVFVEADLVQYLNTTTIFALDDPGAGISADKGARAKEYMDQHNISFEEALLVDDSQGNINTTFGKLDAVKVVPNKGVALDLLQWIEDRAARTTAPTTSPTTATPTDVPTTPQPTMEPTTRQPTKDPTTKEPTTSEPTNEPTTRQPTDVPTTLMPSTQAPTEAPTVNASCPVDEIQGVFMHCRRYDLATSCSDACGPVVDTFVNATTGGSIAFHVECLRAVNASQPWVNGALDTFIERFQNSSVTICTPLPPSSVNGAGLLVPGCAFGLSVLMLA